MIISTRLENKKMCVILSGRIEEEDAERMRNTISYHIDNDIRFFDMDFSNVEDICTGGIVALMILKKKAVKNDCKIVVTGLTESIRANFELHKLNIMLGI